MASDGTKDDASLRKGDLIPDHALTEREPDEFKHTAIAERVADLVTTADPPLNVALFGPWGSGKSSFATLLKSALSDHPESKIAFVVYDAWKYSGEALQRTFITEAAQQLKIDDEYFTSQLAQTIERMQVDLKQSSKVQMKAHLRWVSRLVVPAPAILTGVLVLITVIASAVANRSISRELLGHAWLLAAPLLVVVVGAALKPVADTATLKAVEGPPSEEGFEKRFKDLLKKATDEKGYKRFLFFIDELDRVAPKDVIETLGIIKNFLDQKNAVFVVAADKQVLERAFKKLPQATPTNEDEPYYSSASEFIDKIFQHQIALPPLRGQSLYRFAHDLVANRRGGLWEELKNADDGGARLDDVLYILIPSHVRSPRRVKVLLNNFATNARIAQSRGITWLERAQEIAKLTALQTEFPLLAADLHSELRLPRLVLSTEGFVLSERTRQLLMRHGVAVDDDAPPDEELAEEAGSITPSSTDDLVGATDALLVPRAEQGKLISVQRENLRRYLFRVEDVPDPSGALLFLEAGGASEGLADSALGDLIEAEARDNPAAVVAAVLERTREEKQAVVRVLAAMSEQAYARERSNIITALLDVVRELDLDLGGSVQAAAGAVASYARSGVLDERQLVGALRVGIAAARSKGESALRDEMLADDRLLAVAPRVWSVAPLIDDLPDDAVGRVRDAIAAHLPETTDVLTEPLYAVSPEAADDLLGHPKIKQALEALLKAASADEAEEIAQSLFDVIDGRDAPAPTARLRLMRLLADSESPAAYTVLRDQAEGALDAAGTSQIANGVGLASLILAPPGDWELWLPWLDDNQEALAAHEQMAEIALIKVVGQLPQANEDDLGIALALVPRVAKVGHLDDEPSAALTQTAQGALQATAWWLSDGLFDLQELMHEIVRALGEAVGEVTAASFANLRHQDLVRCAANAGFSPALFSAVARWAVEMDAAQVRDLATRLSSATLAGDQERDVELVAARTRLWAEGWELDEDVEESPYAVPVADIVAVARSGSPRGQEVVIDWLEIGVVEETVLPIIAGIDRPPSDEEAEAFRTWFKNLQNTDARTKCLTALTRDGSGALDWLRAAVATRKRDYSEQVIAHSVVSDAMNAPRAEERQATVDALFALAPREPEAQRELGRLIIWLLDRKQKIDFEIALSAVGALGRNHTMGRSIGDAFRMACERDQKKIPHREKAAFADAKIVLGQNYFEGPPKKKGPLSRLIGR